MHTALLGYVMGCREHYPQVKQLANHLDENCFSCDQLPDLNPQDQPLIAELAKYHVQPLQ
jgi:hypothetical protein